jgi:hypothetical protein
LPQPCVGMEGFYHDFFLAYDPLMSPHDYMILNFPLIPFVEANIKFTEHSEWPPLLIKKMDVGGEILCT